MKAQTESCIDLRKRLIVSPREDITYLFPFVMVVLAPIDATLPSRHMPLWLEISRQPGAHVHAAKSPHQTLEEYLQLPYVAVALDGKQYRTHVARAEDYDGGKVAYVQLDDGNYLWTCVPK